MTLKKSIWILLALFINVQAFAEDIEVPEEELARETALPVFDKRRAVLNRSVVTAGRFELGAGAGLEMNEAYYNDFMLNVQGTYNYDETNAINVQFLNWMDGLSSYGEQLKAGKSGANGFAPFDASQAPHPVWGLFANYQFVAYYGKISVSKQGVMNLNLFGLAGLGYINMDSANAFGLNLGVGQNFFFTDKIGMRLDLRMLIFQGPDATSKNLNTATAPSADSFGDRIYYNTQLGLSVVAVL